MPTSCASQRREAPLSTASPASITGLRRDHSLRGRSAACVRRNGSSATTDASPYNASPFNSRGTSPDSPAAWRMNRLFSGGVRSTSPRPMSRTVRSKRRFVGEQEIQRVGGKSHRHGVEPPPALIALEHVGLPEIDAEPRGVDHDFGQCRDILQAHVEPLARDRVDHMRGVADQRQPLGDEGARDEIAERKRARLVERLDLAEMQAKALLELAVKFVVAQAQRCARLRCGSRSTPATSAFPSAAGSRTARREENALRRGPDDRVHGRR